MDPLHRGRFLVGESWRDGWDLRLCPHAKFCIKKSLKGIYPFGPNLYHKLQILAILGAVNPHFKATTVKFVAMMRTS